jgi:hypothetical protein
MKSHKLSGKWLGLFSAAVLGLLALSGCAHKVFVVGGVDNSGNFLDTAELFDPGAGVFIKSAHVMSTARLTTTATTLTNDTVLIAGGQGPTAPQTAEIYNSLGDSFAPAAGMMNHVHVAHTATLLDPAEVGGALGGDVLIAGGDQFSVTGSAELYHPGSQTFTNTGAMSTPRIQHTAVLISHCGCAADGKVLVAGGYDNQGNVLASAELYDPATQTFSATGNMQSPRFRHTATLLNDGTVLIAGGASQLAAEPGDINPSLNTAEIYDPKAGTFSFTKGAMTAHREAHGASLLHDGTVLLTGGQDDHFLIENSAEIYDPAGGSFSATSLSCAGAPPPPGCMSTGRDFHISQTLDDGRVLLAGGVDSVFQTVASAELYDPMAKTFSLTGSMSTPRSGAAASLVISLLTPAPPPPR